MNTTRSLLNQWRSDSSIGTNFMAWETIPARSAVFKPFPCDLHPSLRASLEHIGIRDLYTHQSESWNLTKEGNHIAVVTGTASGKSMCYNIPTLHDLFSYQASRALYIFPTKALAHDQLALLKRMLEGIENKKQSSDIFPAAYDGETPNSTRSSIRNQSRLILTNPDMLHTGVLPNHTSWESFFRNLHFVIIDEIHIYRGVFGSHVANVIRRLKRISNFYGASLQFILTSATIGNPIELAENLIEAPVSLIDKDGSERGTKYFVVYNPPILEATTGLRASMVMESLRLAEDLLNHQIQTIIFGRSRRTVELMLRYLRSKMLSQTLNGENNFDKVIRAYRSGYLSKQRREIEAGIRSGKVKTVIATTALELGIDIGRMGSVIIAGYPGTISGIWQQAGRAGRAQGESLAILVTSTNPVDQYMAKHPEYIFTQPSEKAWTNPNNLLILLDHLRCASFELTFTTGDKFGNLDAEMVSQILAFLASEGVLYKSDNRYFWMSEQNPAILVSLRNASVERYILQDMSTGNGKIIGEVDGDSAFWMVHPQAVYLHEGETYIVESLDMQNKVAHVRQFRGDYYTKPSQETEVELLSTTSTKEMPGGFKAHGEIRVTTQVTGFYRIQWGSQERLDFHELSLPQTDLLTTAYWLKLNVETVNQLREVGLWSNDPNYYGANWIVQRNLARKRDNYQCQACGALEGDRLHHVHHKIPFRFYKSSVEANNLTNLLTLCPVCHLRIESQVRIRSGLAGVAYILVNLAPLYVMCDVSDLGVHHDPKSPLNEQQPAIVLYERIPGGIGFSQHLYDIHDELLTSSLELAETCECNNGCPSCVGPGGEWGDGGKEEALALLKALTNPKK